MRDHATDHDANIRNSVAALRELLVVDGMPIGHWAATARWALTRHLTRSFATGDALVGNRAFASHTRASFAQRYRRHVGDWAPERIDNEWPRYCEELLAILNVLDRHDAPPDNAAETGILAVC